MKEFAEIHNSAMRYQSASTAWVNLGLLCSEQMRCEEALEYYERALKIRRSSPNLPEQSLAIVHNNLANCYRRMRRFDEAHLNANLAISLFHEKDKGMSYAYGTRGQIYLDAGEYEKALEWLTKSNEERLRRSDSDQQVILENYENQIVALEALGRNAEAEIIRLNAEHVRKAIESVPLVDIETGATAKPAEDAVFIELTRASAIPPEDEKESRIELTAVLGAAALLAEVGHYCGKVSLPESTTLIFYGSNADDLFAILQPALEAEKNQFHARVSIQKDGVIREVLIQGEGVILQ